MDSAFGRCYPATIHERPLSHDIARDPQRCAGDRAPARAHVRARPLRAERLSASRACGSPARPVVYGADRHAAGGLGAPVADSYWRYQGFAAGIAHDRAPFRGRGVGRALLDRALKEATARGHRLVVLVGDEPY